MATAMAADPKRIRAWGSITVEDDSGHRMTYDLAGTAFELSMKAETLDLDWKGPVPAPVVAGYELTMVGPKQGLKVTAGSKNRKPRANK